MKKPSKEFKKFVRETLQEYTGIVGYRHYTVDILYMKEDKDRDGDFVGGEIEINPTYLRCDVSIFPVLERMYNDGEKERVKETLVHEMCHLITEPLYRIAIDYHNNKNIHPDTLEEIREQQTERIKNALLDFK